MSWVSLHRAHLKSAWAAHIGANEYAHLGFIKVPGMNVHRVVSLSNLLHRENALVLKLFFKFPEAFLHNLQVHPRTKMGNGFSGWLRGFGTGLSDHLLLDWTLSLGRDPLPFIKLTCNDPGGISTWTTSSRLSASPHFWLAMLMGLRLCTKLSWDLFLINWYLRDRQEFAFVLQIRGSMKIAARQKRQACRLENIQGRWYFSLATAAHRVQKTHPS